METTRTALLREARTLMASGAWRDVVTLLHDRLPGTGTSPALIVLQAEALMRVGEPQAARALLEEHAAALVLSGDRTIAGRAANLRGAANLEIGDLGRAEAAFDQALEIGRADQDDLLVARTLNNLAVIASIRGRPEIAQPLYASAILAYQRIGNVNGVAESNHNLAIALRKRGHLGEAEEHERRSAEFARAVGNARLIAMTLVGRAEVALARGDAALAEATAQRAAADLALAGDPARQADALRTCGVARANLGKHERAVADFDRAVELAQAHGNSLVEAESLWARAQLRHQRGEVDAGRADAQLARTLFERLGATSELTAVDAWLHTM